MVFSYYNRLSHAGKRVYRKSDEIGGVPLPAYPVLGHAVDELERALATGNRPLALVASQKFISLLAKVLRVAPVRVEVLAARPSRRWGELHGLYNPAGGRSVATITVWMRTAQRRQVVAFRTFLRTLIHELCHHLDYELFHLPESFHTEGFYKRESSLVHQLVRIAGGDGTIQERRSP
ncbi:MAG: hypothetical protein HYV04_16445 [Deltaproteobacteria bacterium]|nr:hypothetical protein [Deltaproteobacteria bacterium]